MFDVDYVSEVKWFKEIALEEANIAYDLMRYYLEDTHEEDTQVLDTIAHSARRAVRCAAQALDLQDIALRDLAAFDAADRAQHDPDYWV